MAELLSGKRRKHAAELFGKTDMPVIIRDLNDDESVILLVDANLHRPDIPPSERAKAYKMKLEAIKHQGQRTARRGCLFVRQPLSTVFGLIQHIKDIVERFSLGNKLLDF